MVGSEVGEVGVVGGAVGGAVGVVGGAVGGAVGGEVGEVGGEVGAVGGMGGGMGMDGRQVNCNSPGGGVMDEDTTQAAWEYAEELKQREGEENGYE